MVMPAVLVRLRRLFDPKGQTIAKRPKLIGSKQTALVIVKTLKPICVELYKDFKQLGRVILREGGRTIAAGLVEAIFEKSEGR